VLLHRSALDFGDSRIHSNVQLLYEIRGVTSDRQNTVVARFAVRHLQLPDGPNVLDAHSDLPTLTSFPSYKLLEKSRPESFEPSLTELQNMVSSIVILKPKKPENSEVRPVKSDAAGQ
jgi:hypothetical protein